jgi:hypothetical protein
VASSAAAIAAGQHALDQIGNAAPDIAADRLDRQRGPTEVAEHGVGCGMQVEHGIEQRAVEIDEHGAYGEGRRHHALASCARRAAITLS